MQFLAYGYGALESNTTGQYGVAFGYEALASDDNFFEDNNIKIIVDKKSLFYVLGTELDFSDGLNGKGFQFKNPNATRTCGCGESFAV